MKNRLQSSARGMLRSIGANDERAIDAAVSLHDRIRDLEHSGEIAPGLDSSALVRTVAKNLALGRPTPIYAPSCPDYPYTSGKYTFGGVGDGISLLGSYQIGFARTLLPIFDKCGVPFRYSLLTADIEGEDAELCALNGITKEEFYLRTKGTVRTSGIALEDIANADSQGFTEIFADFMTLQHAYESHIAAARTENEKFDSYLQSLNLDRTGRLYQKMFGHARPDQFMGRTIKTMAQYATLGHYARENDTIIINHQTANIVNYNNANLTLEPDPATNFKRIAVINFGRSIY